MSSYSKDEKIRFVALYLVSGKSRMDVAEMIGCDKNTLSQWTYHYGEKAKIYNGLTEEEIIKMIKDNKFLGDKERIWTDYEDRKDRFYRPTSNSLVWKR